MTLSTIKKAALGLFTSSFAVSPAMAGLFDFDPADPGFYIAGFVGSTSTSDTEFEGVSDPVTGVPGPTGAAGVGLSVDVEYDSDTFYGAAVGYKLPFKYWTYFQPRLELEISDSEFDVDGGSFNGGAQAFSGEQSVTFYNLNNYSDIRWSDDQSIIPYIGGGIGIASVDANILYAGGGATAPNFAVQGDDTALTTHAAAGVTLNTSANFDIYGEVRYFTIYDVELERTFIANGADLFVGDVDDDIDGFTFQVGARYKF